MHLSLWADILEQMSNEHESVTIVLGIFIQQTASMFNTLVITFHLFGRVHSIHRELQHLFVVLSSHVIPVPLLYEVCVDGCSWSLSANMSEICDAALLIFIRPVHNV